MKLLVLTVCIAMIAVQVQRIRLGPTTQRWVFLLFWLTVLAWTLTSQKWLAVPAIAFLLTALFWNIGPLMALFGSAALGGRLRRGGSHEVSHVLYRSPLLARARPEKLVRYLDHKDENVRWAAIAEMGSRQDPTLTPALLELAQNDPEARADAIDALGKSGDTSAALLVAAYLDDDDEKVRLRTVGALARLRAPETVERLGEFFESVDRDNHTRGAYGWLADSGGPEAIGWLWDAAPDRSRRNLVGWLRESVDGDDAVAAAVIEKALRNSTGETHRSLEELQRHQKCIKLRGEHPSWFEKVPSDASPETTPQPIRFDGPEALELGLADETHAGGPIEALFVVEAGDDDVLRFRATRTGESSDQASIEREFPRRMLVGLAVRASEENPLRFRHDNPERNDEPFEQRPLLLDLPIAMESGNLAPFHVEGSLQRVKSDHRQRAVVDLAVTDPGASTLSLRIRNWMSPWEREVPPIVGEIEVAEIYRARLVTGLPDPPVTH